MTRIPKINRTSPKVYDPVGRCIYCGSDGGEKGLSREHIIPEGLQGSLILGKASCADCARITSKIETICLQETYVDYRHQMNLQMSKKSKQKMRSKPVSALLLPDLPPPGIISGKPLVVVPGEPTGFKVHGVNCWYFAKDATLKELPPGYVPKTFNIITFLRLLAKIAHGYAVAELGLDKVESWLRDVVLGQAHQDKLQYLIGAADRKLVGALPSAPMGLDQKDPPRYTLHQVFLLVNPSNQPIWGISVGIRLFAIHQTPLYQVAVGTLYATGEMRARFAPGPISPVHNNYP